jgi:hypothetical protein
MRRLVLLLVLGVLCPAGPAAAATLASASFGFQWMVGGLPALSVTAFGATGTATSPLSASLGAGTAFNGDVTATFPTTVAPPLSVVQLVVTKNAGQTFTGTAPGNVGGDLAFEGLFHAYGIGGYPTSPLLSVPLVVGTPSTVYKSSGGVALTAVAGSWTAGTAVVTGVQLPGSSGYGTLTAMGANGLTPGGQGTLVLVSPVRIADGLAGYTAAFGTLTLSYVPEPATLLLLGLGVAALGALGRRRV